MKTEKLFHDEPHQDVPLEKNAFRLFFVAHQAKLYAYILKVVKAPEIAEELVLDIFMKIWLEKDLLTDVRNVDAYLYKIAVNKALDFLRVASRERKCQKLLEEALKRQSMVSLGHTEAKEYQEQIDFCMRLLTERQRTILNLSRVQGLTHQQIAEQLNLSQNTVKNHIINSLRQLRTFLKKGKFIFYFLKF